MVLLHPLQNVPGKKNNNQILYWLLVESEPFVAAIIWLRERLLFSDIKEWMTMPTKEYFKTDW